MSFNFWMTATSRSTLDPSPWGSISTYRPRSLTPRFRWERRSTHWDSLQCGVKEEMEERKEEFNSGPFASRVVQRLRETPSGFRRNEANPRAA